MLHREIERKDSERGFALLLVFFLAGAVALMLYRQLPRVAFETERDREQLLIDRGEQYKRAVQLFYNTNKKFPQTIEELERFQDKRYLRKRYKDPMTGKDEWRLVHSNGAYLTDSLVTKPPTGDGKNLPTGPLSASSVSTTTTTTEPGTDPNQPVAVNQAVLQRPSDRTQPTASFGGGLIPPPGNPDEPPRFNPNTPISLSQMQSSQNGQPQQQQPSGLVPGGDGSLDRFNNQRSPGQALGSLGQQSNNGQLQVQPGQAPNPGIQQPQFRIDANGRFVPVEAVPTPQQQATGGVQQFRNQNASGIPTGPQGPGGNSPAVNIINQLLTTPRQQPGGSAPLPGGITPGAVGIAGVASMSDKPSIKRYKERGKYKEWEFVWDPQAAQAAQGGQAQGLGPDGKPRPQQPTQNPTGFPSGGFPGGMQPFPTPTK